MHERWSRQASHEGAELCKYPWRHSPTKLWKRRIKLVSKSHSACDSKLCPTFRKHRDHVQSQKKFWRQWNSIIIEKPLLLFVQNIIQITHQIRRNSHLALDFQFILSLLHPTCLITISSVLCAELLFIIYYFTVAESEIEASAQVNKKIIVNLLHAEMLQISLSPICAKTYII